MRQLLEPTQLLAQAAVHHVSQLPMQVRIQPFKQSSLHEPEQAPSHSFMQCAVHEELQSLLQSAVQRPAQSPEQLPEQLPEQSPSQLPSQAAWAGVATTTAMPTAVNAGMMPD